MQTTWNLPGISVATVVVVQLPCMLIKLNSYKTWSKSETVPSVQLPLNAVFFCLVEVASHVILWCQCSCSVALCDQVEACFKFRFICQNYPEQLVSWCSHPFSVQNQRSVECPTPVLALYTEEADDSYWSISCFGSFQKVKQSLKQKWAMTALHLRSHVHLKSSS